MINSGDAPLVGLTVAPKFLEGFYSKTRHKGLFTARIERVEETFNDYIATRLILDYSRAELYSFSAAS